MEILMFENMITSISEKISNSLDNISTSILKYIIIAIE